jgi:hypothetical protein
MSSTSILHPTPISTSQLTWIPAERKFVAEDSGLPRPSRVYSDACDLGYTVVSQRTGREVVVAVGHEQRDDAGGGVLYWDFLPVDRSESGLFTLRVLND